MGSKKRGKLIVLEGVDGAGKATQARLLAERLKKSRRKVACFAFPQYETFFGQVVGRMLRGEWGNPVSISPYLAYLPYALDLWLVSGKIHDLLKEGITVVCDRYPPTAGAIYQSIKLSTRYRQKYLQWQDELMFGILNVPWPDIVFFLDVPIAISKELILKKKSRTYLKGKKLDLLEKDKKYQNAVRSMGIRASRMRRWRRVPCAAHGQLLSPEEIHEKIWNAIQEG